MPFHFKNCSKYHLIAITEGGVLFELISSCKVICDLFESALASILPSVLISNYWPKIVTYHRHLY